MLKMSARRKNFISDINISLQQRFDLPGKATTVNWICQQRNEIGTSSVRHRTNEPKSRFTRKIE